MAVIKRPKERTVATRRRRNSANGKLWFLIYTVLPIVVSVYLSGHLYNALYNSLITTKGSFGEAGEGTYDYNDDVTPLSNLVSQPHMITDTGAGTADTDTNNDNADSNENIYNRNTAPDKTDHLVQILEKAGVEVTPDIKKKLPSWNQVDKLYGSKPQIIGLETCAAFQSDINIPKDDVYIGPAGLFNTGTNLLSKLLRNHCSMPRRREKKSNAQYEKKGGFRYRWTGMLMQVPWGKHNPISWRLNHVAQQGAEGVEQRHVLPVVMLKDPFHWMSSMCRHPYAAKWRHTPKFRCPNLVASEGEQANKSGLTKESDAKGRYLFEVRVAFQKTKIYKYTSLVDLYNRWYRDYLEIKDIPRLMIRYEDLLLYPEEIVTKVCHCGGGTVINAMNGIHHDIDSAKPNHIGSSGLMDAVVRYGSEDHRTDTMTDHDLEYANEELDSELMKLFHYSYADASAIQRGASKTALIDAREVGLRKLRNGGNHDLKRKDRKSRGRRHT